MFSFFRKKSPAPASDAKPGEPAAASESSSLIGSALGRALELPAQAPVAAERQTWFGKLRAGLRKTG